MNFVCNLHNELYNAYCKNCNRDICLICEKEHTEHKKLFYGSIIPDKKDLENGINNLSKTIDELKDEINKIIKQLNEIMKNMDIYNKIYNDIINNYNNKKRNYIVLQNILDMMNYNNIFCDRINELNKQKDIVNKFRGLMDIYNQITINNPPIKFEKLPEKREEDKPRMELGSFDAAKLEDLLVSLIEGRELKEKKIGSSLNEQREKDNYQNYDMENLKD